MGKPSSTCKDCKNKAQRIGAVYEGEKERRSNMKIYTIKKLDLDSNNFYRGTEDLNDFAGAIEADENLGQVRFELSLKAKFHILFKAGSGIKAGDGIEAGCGIKAGGSIEAGSGIEAGCGIKAGWSIEAGDGIKAGWSIEAGDGIKAGCGIKAGDGIKAGCGIKAKKISARLRIFAGLCIWRLPTKEEKQIKCEILESGEIAFGELVLLEKACTA